MRNTWLVIRREYLERVRTKAFLISTILVPVFMLAVTLGPQKLATMKTGGSRKIVLVATDPGLARAFQRQIDLATDDGGRKFNVTVDTSATAAERDALRQRVNNGEIDGFLWADAAAIKARKVTYAARETSDFIELGSVRRALSVAATQQRLASRGFGDEDVVQLLNSVDMDTVTLKAGKENKLNGPAVFLLAFTMVFFLYMTLIMYGITVMRSVLEEKSSRILEVLLASVSPHSLMAGKVLGVGAVGLTQVVIWAVAGFIFSGPALLAAKNALGDVKVPVGALIAFPIFFVLGYLLYSASFAALGAAVNSEQDAQHFQMIVMLPIISSMLCMMFVVRQPNAPLAVALSLFPFTAPILMYLRLVVSEPPVWQIAASVSILMLTIWGMMWACARIYRVGILMYGKRPTLPEILKWMRYA